MPQRKGSKKDSTKGVKKTSRKGHCKQHPPVQFRDCISQHVRIAKSQITKAGNGVYWDGDYVLPKGKRIGQYDGKIRTTSDHDNHDYCFRKNQYECIDGSDLETWGPFMNDAFGSRFHNNVQFTRVGGIVTSRDIEPGEELFMWYGAPYWGVGAAAYARDVNIPTQKTKKARRGSSRK